jgi:hypothetical protein
MAEKKLIGSIGMPQSGTHMLANMLGGLLNNNPEYLYKGLTHAKAGHVNVALIKRLDNWHAMFFYYRNQIDRVMGNLVRMHMGDRKNGQTPSAKSHVDECKEFISDKIQEILSNKRGLLEMCDRYALALNSKDLVLETCENKGIICFITPYEQAYENLDFVCERLAECGVDVDEDAKLLVRKKYSVEAVYDFCRTSKVTQRRMLTNHVSHSRGEPYYWAKMFDFREFYNSLPQENRDLIRHLVCGHSHHNLPEELFING